MFEHIASGLRLNSRVGNNLENREEDVWAVKQRLHHTGLFDFTAAPEPHGYITREMDKAVRSFQTQKALRVDGILNPGSETESALWKVAAGIQEDSVPIPKRKPSNLDATGRITWDNAPPIPERKPIISELSRSTFDVKKAPTVNLAKNRVNSLLNNTPAKFDIEFKKTDKILKEAAIDTFVRDNDLAYETVQKHSKTVEKLSKKHGVDPDLVKAIMWDENARGDMLGANRLFDPVGSSQRPMNINSSIWSRLIGKESSRLHDPAENIEVSVILIKRISDRILRPTPGKIASIWHFVGHENTDEFGNDVDIIYNQKPWKQKK